MKYMPIYERARLAFKRPGAKQDNLIHSFQVGEKEEDKRVRADNGSGSGPLVSTCDPLIPDPLTDD